MKRIISLVLVLSMLLCGCGGGKNEPSAPSGPSGTSIPSAPGKVESAELVISPEQTSVTTKDGITVDVGEYVLEGDEVLTVSRLGSEDHSEDGYKIDIYDFKLGDLHELGDFITIRIPYDTTYCEQGQDPAKCVGAKYKNEATGEWEDVLFEVDAEAQELIIYTDHLSLYGAFYVDNEGRRNALITDVLGSGLYMDRSKAVDFGSRIAANDSTVGEDLADYAKKASDTFFDWADRLDNAINVATLGGTDSANIPAWLNTEIPETNQTLFSALGYIATATNLMNIAIRDARGKNVSDGEVLNLIRDVGSKVTSYWAGQLTSLGAEALSVGMAGVLIIDKMLTAFAEEAQSTRLEDIQFVYHHYNEGFSAPWAHKLMKPKDWREKVIEVVEKHPNDPDIAISALEAGFRKYASEFFALTGDQQAEVASDVPNVTVKRIPNFTEAEKEQMIDEYVAYLKDKTMPAVLKSVQVYFAKKSEEAELAAMNEIKEFYNTTITINMREELKDGEKSAYAGYKFRFAPLSDGAVKGSWSGTWPEKGELTDSTTLIGLLTAGLPHMVEFFKPDADMDVDKPEFTVPFVVSVPTISIDVKSGPRGWIDPWEQYQVADIGALYEILRKEKPTKLRVTPIVYYYNDVAADANTDSFIIDLEEGAVTEYATSHYEDDTSQWNDDYVCHITYLFTGAPEERDLMTVVCKRTKDAVKGEYHSELISDDYAFENSVHSLEWYAYGDVPVNVKAFAVTPFHEEVGFIDEYTIWFVIEEIYLP